MIAPKSDTDQSRSEVQNSNFSSTVFSQSHILQLIENFHTGYFFYRILPEPGFQYLSNSIQNMSGYPIEEFYADPQLLCKIASAECREELSDLFQGKTLSDTPLRVHIHQKVEGDGWLEINAIPVMNEAGDSLAIEGLIRDVTRQHYVEIAALEQQAQMASIIETAMDAIIVLNPDQEIVIFNKTAEEMFGYTGQQIIGKPLDILIPEQIRAHHKRQLDLFGIEEKQSYRMGATRVTIGIKANGKSFPIEASVSVFQVANQRFYTAIVRDITERKESEAQLIHLSTHDALTGLNNRAFFEGEIQRFEKRRQYPISVVIADVDNLKYINDMFGHASGDDLLREVAKLFRSAFRSEDVSARLGGDEFGVLLPNADHSVTAHSIERIRTRLMAYNRINRKLPISLSIGTASADMDEPLSEAMKRADQAMYQEKRAKQAMRSELSQ